MKARDNVHAFAFFRACLAFSWGFWSSLASPAASLLFTLQSMTERVPPKSLPAVKDGWVPSQHHAEGGFSSLLLQAEATGMLGTLQDEQARLKAEYDRMEVCRATCLQVAHPVSGQPPMGQYTVYCTLL